MMRVRDGIPVTELILTFLPSFCWQLAREVLLQLEQVEENIESKSVESTLSMLARQRRIERRLAPEPIRTATRPAIYEYKALDMLSSSVGLARFPAPAKTSKPSRAGAVRAPRRGPAERAWP